MRYPEIQNYAIVFRGQYDDFIRLSDFLRSNGFKIIYLKSSRKKLLVTEYHQHFNKKYIYEKDKMTKKENNDSTLA